MRHPSQQQQRERGPVPGSNRGGASALQRTVACVGAGVLALGVLLAAPAAFATETDGPDSSLTAAQDPTTAPQTDAPVTTDAPTAPDTDATDAAPTDAPTAADEGTETDPPQKAEDQAKAPATDAAKSDAPADDETAKDEAPADDAPAADDGDVAFDKIYIVQERQFQDGAVAVAYELAIPDSVTEGDTMQVTFEEPLEYDNSVKPELRDPDGKVVATGELTDPANHVITFTFTDYVDQNKNVKITGQFEMIANDPALEGNLDGQSTVHEITFTQGEQTFTDTLTIDPQVHTPLTKVFNYGVWTAEDQGHEKPENAILWTANSPEGAWEGMTVSLVPADATSTLECGTLTFYSEEVPDGALYHDIGNDNDEQRTKTGTTDDRPSYVSDVKCSEESVSVTYTGHIDDNFLRQFTIEASVKDREEVGQFGSVIRNADIATSQGAVECPDPILGGTYQDFAPSCALVETHWYNFVARDTAVGGGEGEARDARIEVQKYSTDDGATKGDYDMTPGKTLKKGTTEKITFEITNTGEEALSKITLKDATVVGAKLKMTKCDLDGVTLEAGKSVTCEGEVTVDAPGQHGDTATVSAVSDRDGQKVTASDDWWSTVAPDPVKPPSNPPTKPHHPGAPVNHPQPAAAPAPGGSLVRTGAQSVLLFGGAAALLLVLGGAAVAITVRRRR